MIPIPPRPVTIRLRATEEETRQEIKRYLDQLDDWCHQVYRAVKDLEDENGKRT